MISLVDVNNAVKGYVRPLREGEEYFRSGLLLCVGLRGEEGSLRMCRALAAQTSAVLQQPHEIEATIDIDKPDGEKIVCVRCSCKAGESEKCKHAVATLIYLNRTEEDDLDDISCTDVEQQWGQLKASHQKKYEAKRIQHLCHVDKQQNVFAVKPPEVSEETRNKWRNILMNCKSSV